MFLLVTSQQRICRNVLSAQKCFLLTVLRYTLLHVWKGIHLLSIVNVFSLVSNSHTISSNRNHFMWIGQE